MIYVGVLCVRHYAENWEYRIEQDKWGFTTSWEEFSKGKQDKQVIAIKYNKEVENTKETKGESPNSEK